MCTKARTIPERIANCDLTIVNGYSGMGSEIHELKCLKCDHIWKIQPKTVLDGYKRSGGKHPCPNCKLITHLKALTIKLNAKGYSNISYASAEEVDNEIGTTQGYRYVKVTRDECGHSFIAAATRISNRNVQCPKCKSVNKKRNAPDAKIESINFNNSLVPEVNIHTRLLENNNLKLISPYTKLTDSHDLKCLTCDHEFKATPSAKIRAFNSSGERGCPSCAHKISRSHLFDELSKYLANNNIDYLETVEDVIGARQKLIIVKVRNNLCNHIYDASVHKLKNNSLACPECARECKIKKSISSNSSISSRAIRQSINKSKIDPLLDIDEYKRLVRKATESVYRDYKEIINPYELPRRLGDGGYTLIHIKSATECFEEKMPFIECAQINNLKMIESNLVERKDDENTKSHNFDIESKVA